MIRGKPYHDRGSLGSRRLLALLLLMHALPLMASMDLAAVPKCGLNCLVASLPTSQCNLTDSACLCADAHYNDVVTTCVVQNCTIRESLTTKNATWSGCARPTTNRDSVIHGLLVVFLILPTVAFAARVVVKIKKLSPWGADDTTICISVVCGLVFTAVAWLELEAGLGRDIWTLEFDQVRSFLKLFFICEVLYTFALAMVKASFLFFFLRVFPNPAVRIALWVTVAFNAVLGTTFVIADLAQCRPMDYFWNNWDGEHEGGTCININAMAWAHAGINVVLDIWMLALPAVPIMKLHLSRRKKVSILAMFGVGVFLTAVSIVRLSSLASFVDSTNVTVDYFGIAVYSTMEIHVGITCACMPAVYQLINQLRRYFWPSQSRSGNGSAPELPNKTIGRLSYRPRKFDTSTTLPGSSSWQTNYTKYRVYDGQQPSQTCLVVVDSSPDTKGVEMSYLGKPTSQSC